ncbi:MAG: hypothetical protein AB7U61_12180 [Methylocystis sp.]
MSELRPVEWRGTVAHEFQDDFRATLENIGEQLQSKLAKIAAEPLPAELRDLLRELEEAPQCRTK